MPLPEALHQSFNKAFDAYAAGKERQAMTTKAEHLEARVGHLAAAYNIMTDMRLDPYVVIAEKPSNDNTDFKDAVVRQDSSHMPYTTLFGSMLYNTRRDRIAEMRERILNDTPESVRNLGAEQYIAAANEICAAFSQKLFPLPARDTTIVCRDTYDYSYMKPRFFVFFPEKVEGTGHATVKIETPGKPIYVEEPAEFIDASNGFNSMPTHMGTKLVYAGATTAHRCSTDRIETVTPSSGFIVPAFGTLHFTER